MLICLRHIYIKKQMLGLLAPVDPYRKVRRDYGIEFRRTPYIDTTFGEKNKKIIKNTRTIIILLVKIKKSKKKIVPTAWPSA